MKLAREQGLAKRLAPAAYRELRQNHERADLAARALYKHIRTRRFELLQELRGLGRLEVEAHTAGANHPATWDALALVYRERPALLAEFVIPENCGVAELNRLFSAGPELRQQ